MRGAISLLQTSLAGKFRDKGKNANNDKTDNGATNCGETAADEGNMQRGYAVTEGVD